MASGTVVRRVEPGTSGLTPLTSRPAQATVAKSINVGVGTLAGSNVLLLSLTWGGAILYGRCDLGAKGKMVQRKLTRGWDLLRTGISVEASCKGSARLMLLSCLLLYAIPQVPASLGYTHDHVQRISLVLGIVACAALLVVFGVYQILVPGFQQKLINAAKHKYMQFHTAQRLAKLASQHGGLLVGGKMSDDVLDQIFSSLDSNKNGTLEREELQGLLVGVSVGGVMGDVTGEDIQGWFKKFDENSTGDIDRDEFRRAAHAWIDELKHWSKAKSDEGLLSGRTSGRSHDPESLQDALLDGIHHGSGEDELEEDEEDEEEHQLTPRECAVKASVLLLLGTAVCFFFSDPLVDSMTSFADATEIPPFFVAFIAAPLASNASEVVSSLQFAGRKRVKNLSMTFAQVYGAVTMNNTLNLGLFLFLILVKDLSWDFSAEIIVMLLNGVVVGLLGSVLVDYKAVLAPAVLALYPVSIGLVYLLKYKAGLT